MVAAPQGLRRVERGVLANRDQRVLQERPLTRVRVDVARGHARDAEPTRQRFQPPIERAVVALERPL